MAGIIMENVKKRFGSAEVIKGVSMEIASGEFIVFVGPSGCGKSTLLRLIAGLEEITDGILKIGGNIVNDTSPAERGLAMVFQSYALYPHMSVYDNMAFGLRQGKFDRAKIDDSVREAARILRIEELLDRKPKQLSGGQRQRVAIGRAIVRKPSVFLFDEPLSNLDAALRVKTRIEIANLHKRLATTMIYVTHDQSEAMTLADRIVVMHRGMVEQVGRPRDVFDAPQNRFVANFIGSPSMNFIEGTVAHSDGGAVLATDSGMRLPLPDAPDVREGTRLVYGVRPEHLRPEPGAEIRCRVSVVEDTGSETIILAQFGKDNVTVLLREHADIRPGEEIGLAPLPGTAHYFHAKTGARVYE